jgi:DnaK suppressor protein
MTNTDLRCLKEAMESKLKEATHSPDWRDSITIEPSADPADATQQTLEREMATRKLDRDAMIVRDIRAALARLESGDYGVCAHCEETISPKRLAAVPWAALCIHCQEEADGSVTNSADRGVDRGRLLAAA